MGIIPDWLFKTNLKEKDLKCPTCAELGHLCEECTEPNLSDYWGTNYSGMPSASGSYIFNSAISG